MIAAFSFVSSYVPFDGYAPSNNQVMSALGILEYVPD